MLDRFQLDLISNFLDSFQRPDDNDRRLSG